MTQAYPQQGGIPLTPNQHMFQPNLPNTVCFVPPLADTNPELNPYIPAITGLVMHDLQNKSGMAVWRAFFFNMMSENAYQNEQFVNLMKFIVDLTDFNMGAQRMPFQQALSEAVERGVQFAMASRVLAFHQQLAPYIPQNVLVDFQQIVTDGRSLVGAISNFKMARIPNMQGYPQQHMPQAMPSYGQPAMNGMQGYPMANNGYPAPVPMTAQPGRPSAFSAARAPAPSVNVAPMVWEQGRTTVPGTHTDQPRVSRPSRYDMTGITEVSMSPPPGEVPGSQPLGRTDSQPRPVAKWGAATNPREPALPRIDHSQPVVVQPINTAATRPFDLVLTDDGAELAPAYQVNWTFTPTDETPYRFAYDPTQYLLVLRRDTDGTVTEVLIEWAPGMEYLHHELDPTLAAQEVERREIANPQKKVHTWGVVAALRPAAHKSMSVAPKEVESVEIAPAPEDVPAFDAQAGEVRQVATVMQGIEDADRRLKLEGRGNVTKESVELYFDVPFMLVLPDELLAAQTETLGDLPTFDALHDTLLELQSYLDEDTIGDLDQRITKTVNNALREGLNLPNWGIDSFIGDWQELQGVLASKYGPETLAKLNDASELLIQCTFRALERDAADAYVETLDIQLDAVSEALLGADEVEQPPQTEGELPQAEAKVDDSEENHSDVEETVEVSTYPNVVVLVSRVAVTTVPLTRAEIQLDLSTGALVTQEYLPNLYGAVQAVLARTVDHPVPYQHRYLMTRDRKFIEIVRGIADSTAVLLFDRDSID